MKRVLALVMIFVLLFSIVGCTSTSKDVKKDSSQSSVETQQNEIQEKIIRMDGDNLGYPSVYTVSSRGRGYLLMSFIFDTLTWKDDKGVVPLLAKEWKVSDDNKVWTFYLHENAEFTDGKSVTAEDVKFSYEYLIDHPHQWVYLNMIDKVDAVDEHTVKIYLKDVYAPFITDVAGNVPIMPKHIWENIEEPEKFNTPEAVIGSGPLMLESYDKNTGSYIYKANDKYFLGKPAIDKLILTANSNAKESLVNGEIDAAQQIKYGEAMELQKEGKFKVVEGPGFWVLRLYFNFDKPIFNNKDFRQALYYAINRPEIVEKATRNSTLAGNPGHIHPDSEWYYSGVKQYEFNPEKAKQILDDIDIKDNNENSIREYNGEDIKLEMLVPEDKVREAEMMKKYLEDIGIGLEVKAMDVKSVDPMIKDGKFDIALNGHGSFGGDPVLLARFASNDVTMGSTPTITTQGGKSWSNEEFDTYFAMQLKELDNKKRYEQVAEMQKIIAEELPTLTIYYKKITFAYNQQKFDGWFFTKDGVAIAVPTIQNKLIFVNGEWKEGQEN
ncbi:ABC transporter substrate-binding protein [Brassicibacter mesophilus]|uniref:ABC transporter substrate-binding protein n=1 Tax=Brassicibacter mesophilus TaxID=745119 RepID=UPI003D1AE8CB